MKYSHQTKNAVDEATGQEVSIVQDTYKAVNGAIEIGFSIRHGEDASPAVVDGLCKRAKAFIREFEHPDQTDLPLGESEIEG